MAAVRDDRATDRIGLDAVFPTFFLGILIGELRDPRSRLVALCGAVIALALVPFTPPGVPILAAGVAALLGLPVTTVWWTIIGLAVTTALVKAAGPVVFGGRTPHPAFLRVVAMMAPALLAALVVTSALVDQRQLGVGADTVGVLAGGVLLWRGHSVVLAVLVAVAVTAGLRAVT